MKIKAIIFSLLLILSTALYGCGNGGKSETKSDETKEKDTLTIYTTIFPLEDFAKKIGGKHVKVESIYPPNVDAHTYEPSPKTMVEIAGADAFIYTGVGLEGFADAAIETLEKENVKIVKAGEGIELLKWSEESGHHHEDEHDQHAHEDEEANHEEHADHEKQHGQEEANHEEHADHEKQHGQEEANHEEHADHEKQHGQEEANHEEHADHEEEHGHEHGDLDPHVWLDPIHSITLAENIKNAFVELKPEAKEEFEQNFETLKSELEKLDGEFQEVVKNAKQSKILVSHAAYGYWEKRYGIEEISVSGLSPSQEPSQKQLQEIIETAKKNQIKFVIFEQNVTEKIADIVKNEIGAEALTLHNLESATAEERKNNEDYFSLMRKNLETLKKAMELK
jgi:zinc transport system substrate-binding protein